MTNHGFGELRQHTIIKIYKENNIELLKSIINKKV